MLPALSVARPLMFEKRALAPTPSAKSPPLFWVAAPAITTGCKRVGWLVVGGGVTATGGADDVLPAPPPPPQAARDRAASAASAARGRGVGDVFMGNSVMP